jgi:DNA polymerase IV
VPSALSKVCLSPPFGNTSSDNLNCIAQPKKLRSASDVARLPNIGPKLLRLVLCYIDTGTIPEVESTLASPRFSALSLLSSVYGIGPTTARLLYGKGVRTLRDLHTWYDVDPDAPPEGKIEDAKVEFDEALPNANKEDGKESLIRVALGFRPDLEIQIPRAEVEEIAGLVQAELDLVQAGCVATICGGYRRGKQKSNDVDIVFTHPDRRLVDEGLCERVVKSLVEKGVLLLFLFEEKVKLILILAQV